MKAYYPLIGILLLYSLLLAVFPLKLQTIESYAYASAAEGFYDLSTTFQSAQPDLKLPDFSRYHPNHPLMHWIAGGLSAKTRIPALVIFKTVNFISALASLVFFYLLCLRLWSGGRGPVKSGILAAALATTIMGVSHGFWMVALSGEVQPPALAFLLAAIYFLACYLLNEKQTRGKYLLISASLLSVAFAFHLAVFFVLPTALAVFFDPVRRKEWRLYLGAALIVLCGLILFYVILPVVILNVDSIRQYFSTILIYRFLNYIRYTGVEWYTTFLKTWAHVIAYGFLPYSFAVQLVYCGLFAFGFRAMLKSSLRKSVKALLVIWPASYVALQILSNGRADGINYWHFATPAFFIMTGYAFLGLFRRPLLRLLPVAAAVLLLALNLKGAVLPNSSLKSRDFLYVEDPLRLLEAAGLADKAGIRTPLAFLVKEPVYSFPEIYRIGSEFGYRDERIFIACCGNKTYLDELKTWMRKHPVFSLVVDEWSVEAARLLTSENRKFRVLTEVSGEMRENWFPSSLYFERRDESRIFKRVRIFFVDDSLR
jgi:hypothetical protein